jgi:hypothetical protein
MPDAATDDVHAGGREDDRVVFIRVFDQFARAKGQCERVLHGVRCESAVLVAASG